MRNDFTIPTIDKSFSRLNQTPAISEYGKMSTNSGLPPPLRPIDVVSTEEIEELQEFYTRV